MNKLLEEFYQKAILESKDSIEAENRIVDEIENILEPYKQKLTLRELEELKNLLYASTFVAQKEGFLLGMRTIIKFLASILSD